MKPVIPQMTPAPGERCCKFVGDRVCITVKGGEGQSPQKGWRALLRTNLGRAAQLRKEILQSHTHGLPLAGASWRDVPMSPGEGGWTVDMPLVETGFFRAKAYLLDPRGWQHWADGPDLGISVHPDFYRTGNILYCAFTRMFGRSKECLRAPDPALEPVIQQLDQRSYAVIPPSGKLRDLVKEIPHIFDRLGCRILQLLPVNPTPTTYARFGRFGSPYAALDLTTIDPALVEFDRRTTGVDQFRELTYETHLHGGRVFLDMVINHTGWGSNLQEKHPEWFLRNADGTFASPGAWGTTWEDLVELKHQNVSLWDELARVFLTWCERGVDGFRCDAGYKVPVPAWQYIVARVQEAYPNTVFLLEGLGGAWEATEALLTDGGMQWAYSELFQNYSGQQVSSYLDHSQKASQRVGLLFHYSETHDNDRLAKRGRAWSLMRNRLSALTSVSGGFGYTCGVEWLAPEKIKVHGCTGLAWGGQDNIVEELARLSGLLKNHPCFFDGARLTRLSPDSSPVYALLRQSKEGKDIVLVLVNTDLERANSFDLTPADLALIRESGAAPGGLDGWPELLGQKSPLTRTSEELASFSLPPAGAFCLSSSPAPRGLHGAAYREQRAQAAWALSALSRVLPAEQIQQVDWRALAQAAANSPAGFLAKLSRLTPKATHTDVSALLKDLPGDSAYAQVVTWTLMDRNRITPVPPNHWLLVHDPGSFRASLDFNDGSPSQNLESIPVEDGQIACFAPRDAAAEATLKLERYAPSEKEARAKVRYLSTAAGTIHSKPRSSDLVLLTNGRGGMARICIDLGRVLSKYDCVLGANLHPTLPVDRHVLVKRIRVWVNADGFISPLDYQCLDSFAAGPPAAWNFVANAGDGRTVQVQVRAEMIPGENTVVFAFSRPTAAEASGKQLPKEADVRLSVRLDLEDRNFHSETHRNGGADYHFTSNTHAIPAAKKEKQPPEAPPLLSGFAFTPAADRQLQVMADFGLYHPEGEWSQCIPHPVEQSRGQVPAGDAYSPGWFELPLSQGANVHLTISAEPQHGKSIELRDCSGAAAQRSDANDFPTRLRSALNAFIVRRDSGKTVVAGYPWFLDWGRDTFICARGLLAAGLIEEVKEILLTFARFEKEGTLPNTIFGADASNRDTSDAPLWFGLACEEFAAGRPSQAVAAADLDTVTAGYLDRQWLYSTPVDPGSQRTMIEVLTSIANHYMKGTPNGIRMDPASGLIWSPNHFTWMDTNFPAGTPREGYPVEIQALWLRLLRQLAAAAAPQERALWKNLADKAHESFEKYFWLEEPGYYSDVLLAKPGAGAAGAVRDDALRSNALLAVSLGLADKARGRRTVESAKRYLVVPGGLRSLAPLPVSVPLPIYSHDGRLLNDPQAPYWGRYEGDEDTRRKPAYHNGTAWTWTLPAFCEALARAWDFAPEAVAAARAYLASMELLLQEGCLGQIPEVLDGDAPHTQRGCDAQAWSVSEALRVWQLLH